FVRWFGMRGSRLLLLAGDRNGCRLCAQAVLCVSSDRLLDSATGFPVFLRCRHRPGRAPGASRRGGGRLTLLAGTSLLEVRLLSSAAPSVRLGRAADARLRLRPFEALPVSEPCHSWPVHGWSAQCVLLVQMGGS